MKVHIQPSRVTMRTSSAKRYDIFGNKLLVQIVLNSRCSTEYGEIFSVRSSAKVTDCDSTFPMAMLGTPTLCGASPSGPLTFFSWPETCCVINDSKVRNRRRAGGV